MGAVGVGLLAGAVADLVAGDPRRGHPVTAFGSVAAALERRAWRPTRTAGAPHVLALAGGAAGRGAGLPAGARRRRGRSARLADAAARRRGPPEPNAGRMEAAFAGALEVRLGGRNRYGDRVEQRPRLGDGPPPGPRDVDRAVRLSLLVGAAVTVLVAAARR